MSRDAIDKGHAAFLAGMKANDAEALGRLVAADVVFMPPHDQPVAGRQGVVDWFAGVVKQARTVAVAVPQREVIVTGDLGIERGSFIWTVAPTAGGPEIEDRGNFLAVWQRQADGFDLKWHLLYSGMEPGCL